MSAKPRIVLTCLGIGLDEIIESLQWGLTELGYETTITAGGTERDSINILVCACMLNYKEALKLSPRSINFNLEFIGSGDRPVLSATNFALMRNMPNWDYCQRNIDALHAAGITDVSLIPFGYAPVLERILPKPKDIDVVFYGSMSPRRQRLVEQIAARGLRTVWTDGPFWTREVRDDYIARAKVVLELPFYDDMHLFSEARASYLLANRATVVAEVDARTIIEDDMRRSVVGVPYDQMAEACVQLCADARRRDTVAELGSQTFKAREWLQPLRRAIEGYITQNPICSGAHSRDVPPPRTANLIGGGKWRFDCLNVGADPASGADLVLDLSVPWRFGECLSTWRFGEVLLERGSMQRIRATYALERVRDMRVCIDNCMQWLAVGGELDIEAFYELSERAWEHPSHVRTFNESSWLYICGAWEDFGWRDARFDIVLQTHRITELGQTLLDAGEPIETLLRIHRAIESTHVVLRKRALTTAELQSACMLPQRVFD